MFGDSPAVEMRELSTQETWDLSEMTELTCVNHPTAVYLTKNPWSRNIHFIRFPAEAASPEWRAEHGTGIANCECRCPFADLRIVVRRQPPTVITLDEVQ